MPGPAPNADPHSRRGAIELVYRAEKPGTDQRTMAKKCYTKAGIGSKFLLEKVRQLPEGLVNTEDRLTLRRAANRVVGLNKMTAIGDKDQRCYTNWELCHVVLTTLAGIERKGEMIAS